MEKNLPAEEKVAPGVMLALGAKALCSPLYSSKGLNALNCMFF
jgi:hypothetical protein